MGGKKKILFIINPFSGTSGKKHLREKIEKILDKSKFTPKYQVTEYAGHGKILAEEGVKNGYDIIVAVGGDGSVNEIASAVVHSETVLAILPFGSGNGFARHLGIGGNGMKAISYLNKGKVIQADSATVNDNFFINVSGLGYDALVAYKTRKNRSRGFFPYFKTAVKNAASFKPDHLKITLDDKVIEGDYAAAVVANASIYGYNFTIAPHADIQDGIFDIMLIKNTFVPRYFISAFRFFNKSIHKSSLTEMYRSKTVKMEVSRSTHYHVDGEGFQTDQALNFEMHPLSIKILVP